MRKRVETASQKIRHHPFVVPVVTFMVLFFVSLAGYINFSGQTIGASDSHIVTVNIDGKQQVVPTRAQTVGDLLERIGVEIHESDKVEPPLDTEILENDFQVNIYRARPVTIIDGNKKIVVLSAEPTPSGVAKEAGLTLFPEDNVKVTQPNDVLADGAIGNKIVITRSIPIKINLYGVTYDIRTRATTVNELVKEQGLNVSETSVFPSLGTALTANSAVFVTEAGKTIAVTEVAIPQAEQIVDDYNLLFGKTETRDPGQAGKKVIVYDVAADGTRKPLQEVLVLEPIKKVTARGRKINTASVAADKAALMAAAGISSNDFAAVDFIISHESNWRPGALNAGGCAGLGQACPGSKVANACPNWSNDPVCQLAFFSGYANGRYKGWQGAYYFWQTNHWW